MVTEWTGGGSSPYSRSVIKPLRIAPILVFAIALLPSLGAQTPGSTEEAAPEALPAAKRGLVEAFRPELGVIVVQNLDPNSQTFPLITNILGCGVVFPLGQSSHFAFVPSLDFYYSFYEWSNQPDDGIHYDPAQPHRALPTESSERDAFVLALLLDLPLVYSFRVGNNWRLAAGMGLGFNMHLGISAAAEVPASAVAGINNFFWEKGRYFMPSTLFRFEYRLTERVEFGFSARAYWPIFNLWIKEEGIPLLDQGIFGGSLGVRYRL
jgi:hypothetical protein